MILVPTLYATIEKVEKYAEDIMYTDIVIGMAMIVY